MPTMTADEIAAWVADCIRDNERYVFGRITPGEFWALVDARDVQVAAMSPEDRATAQRCMPTTRRGRLVTRTTCDT